jgi:hypothetical protein
MVLALMPLVLMGGVKAGGAGLEGKDEDPPVPESGTSSVMEDELEPTLESNLQPLEPDPLLLPQWTTEEVAVLEAGRPVNLGGGLWTAERYPLQPAPPWPTPAGEPVEPPPAGVLGWELMAQFGAMRDWCVDPQGVLETGLRARLEAHLAAHAMSARHPVRLWVLAPGQRLADVLDDATLHRASFGLDQPGVLAVLSAADPLAGRLVLPPLLAGLASEWRAAVVGRIAVSISPADQLDQLALWLTLEAEPLPSLEVTAGVATPAPATAGLEKPGLGVISRLPWWWAAATVVLVMGLFVRRWRRSRESPRTEATGP